MPGNPPSRPRSHVTRYLACGCTRLSSGAYIASKGCGYRHVDVLAKDDRRAPLVAYVCGCLGHCPASCGNEERLRRAARPIEIDEDDEEDL